MARSELGAKRTCPETGKKFYDLDKDPIVSPYTGKSYPRSFFENDVPTVTELVRERVVVIEEAEADEEEVVEDEAELLALEDADETEAPRKEPSVSPDVDGPGDDDLGDEIEIEDDEEDDTFLADEEEEEDDDVADYIGGGGRDDEE